ncbi:hypothetical protein BGZ60DRAFT_552645 [Tricladium varicosporioides]|nr:hypothetical protein BGZ60DRAFT_552645 [Hymenoscyphus varicosporioides]
MIATGKRIGARVSARGPGWWFEKWCQQRSIVRKPGNQDTPESWSQISNLEAGNRSRWWIGVCPTADTEELCLMLIRTPWQAVRFAILDDDDGQAYQSWIPWKYTLIPEGSAKPNNQISKKAQEIVSITTKLPSSQKDGYVSKQHCSLLKFLFAQVSLGPECHFLPPEATADIKSLGRYFEPSPRLEASRRLDLGIFPTKTP